MTIGDTIHISGVPHRITHEFPVRHAMTESDEQKKQRMRNGQPEPTYGYTVAHVEKIKRT